MEPNDNVGPRSSSFEKLEEENIDKNIELNNSLSKEEIEINRISESLRDSDKEIINKNTNTAFLNLGESQSESLGYKISRLSNLDYTDSEQKIVISNRYDLNVIGKNKDKTEEGNENTNLNEINLDKRNTNINNITEYKNENIYTNVRFTESVNQRFDDYKKTTNFQKLIEDEILKEKASVPLFPESVLNPKIEKEEDKEVEESNALDADDELDNKEEYISHKSDSINNKSEKSKENEEDEQEINLENENINVSSNFNENNVAENIDERKHRQLTMINRQTDITVDQNFTLLDIANDLKSENEVNIKNELLEDIKESEVTNNQFGNIGKVTVKETSNKVILEGDKNNNTIKEEEEIEIVTETENSNIN